MRPVEDATTIRDARPGSIISHTACLADLFPLVTGLQRRCPLDPTASSCCPTEEVFYTVLPPQAVASPSWRSRRCRRCVLCSTSSSGSRTHVPIEDGWPRGPL